ncbi:MAG: 2-dehydropantoate 2-reductase [Sedimentitalea sp.]
MSKPHIVIAGAGSIGCFVGALLADAGRHVTLLGRARVLDAIATDGLTVTDFSGLSRHVGAEKLGLATAPDCFASADLILVTVKTGASAGIAADIARLSPRQTPVVSLQNGVEAASTLAAHLPEFDLRAGMVPFNVVPKAPGHFHRATSGEIHIASGPTDLTSLLSVPDLQMIETAEITAVQWGKLLVNLNNALNALSGLTLYTQLGQRDWRRLMADQMVESLAVLQAAGIATKSTQPVPDWLVPHILRLPTPIFRRVAAKMLTIDPEARTSMAYDLIAARPTEIEALQGTIIALGAQHGVQTPINTRVRAAVLAAQPNQNALSPEQLRG